MHHKIMAYFCCFWLCTLYLGAEDPFSNEKMLLPDTMADTSGVPSNLVNQTVCVITGHYVDHFTDFVLAGPEPLVLNRTYVSRGGKHKSGWGWNRKDILTVGCATYSAGDSDRLIDGKVAAVDCASGGRLIFSCSKKKLDSKRPQVEWDFWPTRGLTNYSSEISGRTNPKNFKAFYNKKENQFEVVSEAGDKQIYSLNEIVSSNRYFKFYRQEKEVKVNGHTIQNKPYIGHANKQYKISTFNTQTNKIYNWMRQEKLPGNFQDHLTEIIDTSDGRRLILKFGKHKYKDVQTYITADGKTTNTNDRVYYCLKEIKNSHGPSEKYDYAEHEKDKSLVHITCKKGEGKRFLSTNYYRRNTNTLGGPVGNIHLNDKDDYRIDRVKSQQAPVGPDNQPITIYSFVYHAKQQRMTGGFYNKMSNLQWPEGPISSG